MIAPYLQWILLVSGILTALAILIFISPNRFYKSVFNLEQVPTVYLFVARHWGAMISLVGFMLIYAAFNPAVQELSMIIASVEKIVFAGMVMFGPLRNSRVFVRLATFDIIIVVIFALYFAGV